jgi:hypothetical protein
MRKYEPQDIAVLRENLSKTHGDKRNEQEWDADLYNQNPNRVRQYLPSDVPIYQSSLATEVVDEVSDSLRTDAPVIRYRPRSRGRDAENERHRARMTTWGYERLKFDQAYADIDPYNQAGLDLALRGEAILKVLHNADFPLKPTRDEFPTRSVYDDALADWRTETSTISPLLPTQALDPLGVYTPPDAGCPLSYIVQYQVRRQIDMWEQYPDWKEGVKNKVYSFGVDERAMNVDELNDPVREVEWLECWTESHYIIWVGGVEVIRKPNPYGFVPYAHVYSGLGRSDVRGNTAEKAASILSKVRGEIEAEIVGKTIKFELAKLYVFPRIMVPRGTADDIADSLRARGIIEYEPDMGPDSIKWLDSPPINTSVAEFMDSVERAIAKRVNPIMRGMAEQESDFGVLEALRLGQATKGIQQIATNLNRLSSNTLNIAASIVQAMNFDYEDMRKDDFVEPHFEIEFKAIDPVEETRRHMAGLALYRADRAITKRTLRKEFLDGVITNIEDEEEQEMTERAEEAFYASDAFQQYAIETYTAERQEEMARDARDNAEQMRGQQAGPLPGAGPPPGAGIPPGAGTAPENLMTTVEQLGGPGADTGALAQTAGPIQEARSAVELP